MNITHTCPMAKGKYIISLGLYEIDNEGNKGNVIIGSSMPTQTIFENDNEASRQTKLLNDLGHILHTAQELVQLAVNGKIKLNEDGSLNVDGFNNKQ